MGEVPNTAGLRDSVLELNIYTTDHGPRDVGTYMQDKVAEY
jgi:hypothetical protein